ncbi:hypothetical protein MO867_20635 [Microbulbifer sp. OS29]|uniref:Uncharacterized protein n=1 Tax=Microbulbifer okhotskensis TaxID=2926617 RepID=A0A9X2EWL7_9GAMM|nr:hypothetical protein [Microbulbifer okhotskensis]MCO1336738.1 hypothetical protein [Microbulbifer okhotskensis]
MNIKHTLTAVFLSPLASLLLVIVMVVDSLFRGPSLLSLDGLIVILMFAFGIVAVSFVLVLFFGVPLHFLLSKLNIGNWWAYALTGLVVAISFQFIQLTDSIMPAQLQQTGYGFYAVGGFVVSLAFWFCAVKSHNNNRQGDAKDARLL